VKLLGKQESAYALVHAIVPKALELSVQAPLEHPGEGVKIVVSSVKVNVAFRNVFIAIG
jgi:DNA-directed RNA polymerase subunit K/omega